MMCLFDIKGLSVILQYRNSFYTVQYNLYPTSILNELIRDHRHLEVPGKIENLLYLLRNRLEANIQIKLPKHETIYPDNQYEIQICIRDIYYIFFITFFICYKGILFVRYSLNNTQYQSFINILTNSCKYNKNYLDNE